MATYHGVRVNFGISSTVDSAEGQFQTRDHGLESDTELIRNGVGEFISKTFYGFRETATFEYVATQSGSSAGNATVSYPIPGDMVTITDTVYPAIAHTNWMIDKVDIRGANVAAQRVTLTLTEYPLITS